MERIHTDTLPLEKDLLLDGQVEHLIVRILFIVIKHVNFYIKYNYYLKITNYILYKKNDARTTPILQKC
jgi:hypothetical protein